MAFASTFDLALRPLPFRFWASAEPPKSPSRITCDANTAQESFVRTLNTVARYSAADRHNPRFRWLLAADAGFRIGEIRALTWADIDELAREITICRSYDRSNKLTETKGWKVRAVPISPRLWEALAALPRQANWVIARIGAKEPLGYDTMREAIHRLYREAAVNVPTKPWHSLRHTFGTELASAGVPVHTIKSMMGHASIETTLRYMHTDRTAKREAIDRLHYRHSTDDQTTEKKNPTNSSS